MQTKPTKNTKTKNEQTNKKNQTHNLGGSGNSCRLNFTVSFWRDLLF